MIVIKKKYQYHGKSRSRIYSTWSAMKARCSNPNHPIYKFYGLRDIKVCDRWQKFNNFYEDMLPTYQDNLTLDRIDTNGDYEPNNCRWATRKMQSANTRKTRYYESNGERLTMADWARKLGISRASLAFRIDKWGWDPIRAITTPKPKTKGYSYDPKRKKYHVSITVNGKSKYVCRCSTEEEAQKAYAQAELALDNQSIL